MPPRRTTPVRRPRARTAHLARALLFALLAVAFTSVLLTSSRTTPVGPPPASLGQGA